MSESGLTEKRDNAKHHAERDTIIASLLYLMSRFAMSNDQALAMAVADHLAKLANSDDTDFGLLRSTSLKLHKHWLSLTHENASCSPHGKAESGSVSATKPPTPSSASRSVIDQTNTPINTRTEHGATANSDPTCRPATVH